MSYAIGIDVGGTNVKAVAVERDGKTLLRQKQKIGDESVRSVATSLYRSMREQLGAAPDAVGVAAPGIANPDGKSIWWMQGRLEELQGFEWDLVPSPVPVLNDAQAALLGEVWQGAAKGCNNVIMLTLGTGVGGAAMVDGRLLRGHLGRAGHLGHISLDPRGPRDIVNTPGSLEETVGDCTIERRSSGKFRSTAEMIATDNDDARRIWSTSIRSLACGIASLVNVLDPEIVILGGGMLAAGEKLFAPLRAEMNEVEWRPHGRAVKIVPATLGEYAGAIGAAHNALKNGKP